MYQKLNFRGLIKTIILASFTLLVVYGLFKVTSKSFSTTTFSKNLKVEDKYKGPFISDPEVLARLDFMSPDGDCKKSGVLSFPCLVQAKEKSVNLQMPDNILTSPFNLSVTKQITATIKSDLKNFQKTNAVPSLYMDFLEHQDSRLELVGIINRMDRKNDYSCGEISLIYRFRYSINKGKITSRVPVTMNVVFPAVPKNLSTNSQACEDIAKRWEAEIERPVNRPPEEIAKGLLDNDSGILASINGLNISRIELNMQVFRIPASEDVSDLGSSANYLIRVFRWKDTQFVPSYLPNQIDRARLLGNAAGDENSCQPGKIISLNKQEFINFLLKPENLAQIDNGLLKIPEKYLACRAVSGSPGGAYRSINNQFWDVQASKLSGVQKQNALKNEQLLTNSEIEMALNNAKSQSIQLDNINNAEDFRMRINEQTCTGCHQARAIAGFHFPGADRKNTPTSNAVFLPGSPHFYGDQPRRLQIVKWLSEGHMPTDLEQSPSFSSRPDKRFANELKDTELIGGWGATCLMPQYQNTSKTARQWDCQNTLECKQLFKSENAPGLGTCVTKGKLVIGDALQTGEIFTNHFTEDKYLRDDPKITGNNSNRRIRDTRINLSLETIKSQLLPINPLNSYFGAHQEFYFGKRLETCKNNPDPKCFEIKRDYNTGGFSAGMLRLSECIGLPTEATCALVATTGFNDCIGNPSKTLDDCFAERTSYAGLRAFDMGNPCRDDYICLRPLGYTVQNIDQKFEDRKNRVKNIYEEKDFGQKKPDMAWLTRNNGEGDQRGVCIPPYFVFQFRSDGHPHPLKIK